MKPVVILVEPEYQMNIGFVARAMKNFGVGELILVNPPEIRGEAYKFAMHARDVLEAAKIVESLEDALAAVDLAVGTTAIAGKKYIAERAPITPRELKQKLEEYPGKVGLFFGRESRGLENEELELMDLTVRIPASEAYPTMNLSHAVAVVLYELYEGKTSEVRRSLEPATWREKDAVVAIWGELLEVLEYPKDPVRRRYFKTIFRRLIGRSFLYGREAHSIAGPLRKAVEELRRCKNAERGEV
ncbi:RNA methyltransferase [Thermococcus sp.]